MDESLWNSAHFIQCIKIILDSDHVLQSAYSPVCPASSASLGRDLYSTMHPLKKILNSTWQTGDILPLSGMSSHLA